jgi:hypothetical protein
VAGRPRGPKHPKFVVRPTTQPEGWVAVESRHVVHSEPVDSSLTREESELEDPLLALVKGVALAQQFVEEGIDAVQSTHGGAVPVDTDPLERALGALYAVREQIVKAPASESAHGEPESSFGGLHALDQGRLQQVADERGLSSAEAAGDAIATFVMLDREIRGGAKVLLRRRDRSMWQVTLP